MSHLPTPGASSLGDGRVHFCVWAPNCERVDLRLLDPDGRTLTMERDDAGYFQILAEDVPSEARYWYVLDGETERPDPASRYQPDGVHGPSMVVDPDSFEWTDQTWHGCPLDDYVIYELHVGTFSDEGTFDGAISHLDDLVDLGVTVVEILPVAQFPGSRNWGYDGVGLYAVQNSYGGPDGLRRLVDACHQRGLAVVLDVVYNHLGPEGNYLREFGPYFTDHYQTPWGDALNFDGPDSDHVRNFFVENARYWLREYHLDGFRLDAVHAIYDASAKHILEELAETVHRETDHRGFPANVIAESDLNDPKVIRSRELGGWGHDAQWADDFHHALHAVLTGERDGYYVDYGTPSHLVTAIRQGYVFTGQYSRHRQRSHGRWPGTTDGRRFIVCSQNHDQIGNRATGDRLSTNLDLDQLKIAAGLTVLSPFLPMLFQGEEYAESNPFQYFVSHGDPDLVKAVQEGRKREFEAFNWQAEVPDPQAESTFERSRLKHKLKDVSPHEEMFAWYRELIRLRREIPALRRLSLEALDAGVVPGTSVIWILRRHLGEDCLVTANLVTHPETVTISIPAGKWRCILNSQDSAWEGSGEPSPHITPDHGAAQIHLSGRSFFVYTREADSGP